MSKSYDCRNVHDLVHEYNRLCEKEQCGDCPVYDYCDSNKGIELGKVTAELIHAVQKWSDNHPVVTREELLARVTNDPKREAIVEHRMESAGVHTITISARPSWWLEVIE